MQFLVLTERRMDLFPPEEWTAELLELEANRVRALYTSGALRQVWRRKDKPGAVLLFEGSTEEEIRGLAGTLPLAERGMLQFALVTGLEPYPGFAPR